MGLHYFKGDVKIGQQIRIAALKTAEQLSFAGLDVKMSASNLAAVDRCHLWPCFVHSNPLPDVVPVCCTSVKIKIKSDSCHFFILNCVTCETKYSTSVRFELKHGCHSSLSKACALPPDLQSHAAQPSDTSPKMFWLSAQITQMYGTIHRYERIIT